MKITEEDLLMFRNLAAGTIGKQLVEYLRKLEAHLCDSRTWGEFDTKESSNRLAKILESELCDKIMSQNPQKSPGLPEDFT